MVDAPIAVTHIWRLACTYGARRKVVSSIRRWWPTIHPNVHRCNLDYNGIRLITLAWLIMNNFLVWLYASIVFYVILSTAPRVIMINGWANISTSTLFAFPVYYTARDEDYYIYIQSYACVGLVIVLTILIAVDGMFVVLIQHGCGIFAAVRY